MPENLPPDLDRRLRDAADATSAHDRLRAPADIRRRADRRQRVHLFGAGAGLAVVLATGLAVAGPISDNGLAPADGVSTTSDEQVTPGPTVPVTPEPTVPVTPEPSIPVTPAPTVSVSREPSVSVSPDPTVSATPPPTVSVTGAPTISVSPEPTISVTPTP